MLGNSNLSISNFSKSGKSSLSFLTVKKSNKKEYASCDLAHTPKFAQPPLSPDLVPKIFPK